MTVGRTVWREVRARAKAAGRLLRKWGVSCWCSDWTLGGDRDGEERAGLRTHFPAVTHCDVGRRRHAPRGGVSAWGGVSPSPCGVGPGRGLSPSPSPLAAVSPGAGVSLPRTGLSPPLLLRKGSEPGPGHTLKPHVGARVLLECCLSLWTNILTLETEGTENTCSGG